MKRILITGARSYLGTNVEHHLQRYNAAQGTEVYRIDTLSQLDETWESYRFSLYDAIYHVTGIAHADVDKVSKAEQEQYYRVNRDIALQTARLAREQGVKQFIYMSSLIVYGNGAPIGQTKHITRDTPTAPSNFYGDSKLQAEQGLRELANERFHVAILRCPFVYGSGCKGNYPALRKLAEKAPVFPNIANQRSMIYVENLAEFVRLLIDKGIGGTFFPQNAEYATTSELVRLIAQTHGKKIYLWNALNPLAKLAAGIPGKTGKLAGKAFGSLTVDQAISTEEIEGYRLYPLEESIRKTEQRNWT